MQASTVDTPTTGYCGTIFVAIELSQKTWLVTLHSPDRDRISRHKLEGGDHAGLLELIEKVRARAAEKFGSAPRVVSCYEAGYDGFWLHRLLEAAGIANHGFDPSRIAVGSGARPSCAGSPMTNAKNSVSGAPTMGSAPMPARRPLLSTSSARVLAGFSGGARLR